MLAVIHWPTVVTITAGSMAIGGGVIATINHFVRHELHKVTTPNDGHSFRDHLDRRFDNLDRRFDRLEHRFEDHLDVDEAHHDLQLAAHRQTRQAIQEDA